MTHESPRPTDINKDISGVMVEPKTATLKNTRDNSIKKVPVARQSVQDKSVNQKLFSNNAKQLSENKRKAEDRQQHLFIAQMNEKSSGEHHVET